MMTSKQRAALVMDLVAWEFKEVKENDLATIQFAIEAQIEEALRDQLAQVNKGKVAGKALKQIENRKLPLRARKMSPN